MNRKIIDILFGFIIFSLPFKYIPKAFWQLFFGGPYGQNLVVYPLVFGFLYTVYCIVCKKEKLYRVDVFIKFLFAYLGILLISLLWGVYSFPYYEQVMNGPLTQIRQLPTIMTIFEYCGVQADEQVVLKICIVLRAIKGILFETLYTFVAAYMIYAWYHDRMQRAIQIILNIVTFDLIIIAVYGLIDVCYQNGQMWAQNVLEVVNPLLHAEPSIKWSALEYHPALFWNGQVRSIFLEPSYFGNYMAFAFPFLFWNLCISQNKYKKTGLFLLLILLTFEIILSKSRTGIFVLLGESVLYALIVLIRRERELIRSGIDGIICCLIAISLAFTFIQFAQVPVAWMGSRIPLTLEDKNRKNESVKSDNIKIYIDDTFASVIDNDKLRAEKRESNNTRFTIIVTDLQIGKEYLLLGVGKTLRSPFLRNKLDDDPGREIQNWNKRADEKGVLALGGMYSVLNDYSFRFAETGTLGMLIFCFPMIIIFLIYLKNIFNRKIKFVDVSPFIFCSISFAGMVASGLGDSLTLTFCPWLILGVSFIICFRKKI